MQSELTSILRNIHKPKNPLHQVSNHENLWSLWIVWNETCLPIGCAGAIYLLFFIPISNMVQTSLMSMSQMSWAASYLLTLSLNSYFEGLHPEITVNRVLFLLLPFAISEIYIKNKKTKPYMFPISKENYRFLDLDIYIDFFIM